MSVPHLSPGQTAFGNLTIGSTFRIPGRPEVLKKVSGSKYVKDLAAAAAARKPINANSPVEPVRN